jgi:hypothetical protein
VAKRDEGVGAVAGRVAVSLGAVVAGTVAGDGDGCVVAVVAGSGDGDSGAASWDNAQGGAKSSTAIQIIAAGAARAHGWFGVPVMTRRLL